MFYFNIFFNHITCLTKTKGILSIVLSFPWTIQFYENKVILSPSGVFTTMHNGTDFWVIKTKTPQHCAFFGEWTALLSQMCFYSLPLQNQWATHSTYWLNLMILLLYQYDFKDIKIQELSAPSVQLNIFLWKEFHL